MEQIGAIAELIDALKKLPGVGPRAAQRIAYQLLNGDRSDANRLGEALLKATKTVHRCARCNNLTDGELCSYCSSHNRDDSLLCIVESVADLMVIEQSLSYHGRYFILMGRLSPLNGVFHRRRRGHCLCRLGTSLQTLSPIKTHAHCKRRSCRSRN